MGPQQGNNSLGFVVLSCVVKKAAICLSLSFVRVGPLAAFGLPPGMGPILKTGNQVVAIYHVINFSEELLEENETQFQCIESLRKIYRSRLGILVSM